MDRRMSQDLDRYITGNYGEDEFGEECGECGGEGWVVADCFEDTCCCADPELEHGMVRCDCNPRKGKL